MGKAAEVNVQDDVDENKRENEKHDDGKSCICTCPLCMYIYMYLHICVNNNTVLYARRSFAADGFSTLPRIDDNICRPTAIIYTQLLS
jgi:hypothetical protein